MKRIFSGAGAFVLALSLVASGCSGIQPLKKGTTERCPTCGVEYPAGSKHGCKNGQQH